MTPTELTLATIAALAIIAAIWAAYHSDAADRLLRQEEDFTEHLENLLWAERHAAGARDVERPPEQWRAALWSDFLADREAAETETATETEEASAAA